MLTVTDRPDASFTIALQVAGLTPELALTAVATKNCAVLPGPGESVAQSPAADGSSVILQVSLNNVNVVAGVSFGVNVAVSPVAVNCTEPALDVLPFVHASVLCAHCTVIVIAPGDALGVGDGLPDGVGVGDGLTDGAGDGVGAATLNAYTAK